MSLSQTLFAFGGRIGRLRYFIHYLLVMGVASIISLGAGRLPPTETGEYSPLALTLIALSFALNIWCGTALGVKRLHDIGYSGWILLISYALVGAAIACAAYEYTHAAMGFAALIFLFGLWLLFFPGEEGANAYGPPA